MDYFVSILSQANKEDSCTVSHQVDDLQQGNPQDTCWEISSFSNNNNRKNVEEDADWH